jgi:hypothetical protein
MASLLAFANGSPAGDLALHKPALPNDSGTVATGQKIDSLAFVINGVTMEVFGCARR